MAGGCHRRNKAGAGDRQVTWLSPDCDIMDKNIGAGKVGLATAFDKRSLVWKAPRNTNFNANSVNFSTYQILKSTSLPQALLGLQEIAAPAPDVIPLYSTSIFLVWN